MVGKKSFYRFKLVDQTQNSILAGTDICVAERKPRIQFCHTQNEITLFFSN